MGYEALACGMFLFFLCAGFGMMALKRKKRAVNYKPLITHIPADAIVSTPTIHIAWEKSSVGLFAQRDSRIAVILRDAGKIVLRLSRGDQIQFIDIDSEESAKRAGESFLRGIHEG